jgi:hypothetical protein
MTQELDSKMAGTVTALRDENDHPIRRSTFTPAEGMSLDLDAPLQPLAAPTAPPVSAPASVASSTAGTTPFVDEQAPDTVETPVVATGSIYPIAPERGSLEDEHLVPLVARHTDDTATIDLIGILQAQMQLRATEAARFAAWEEQMRRFGTPEAMGEVERTRLHFTGVIPVQSASPSDAAPVADPSPAAAPVPLSSSADIATPSEVPAAPSAAAFPTPSAPASSPSQAALTAAPSRATSSTPTTRARDHVPSSRSDTSRILVLVVSIASLAVVAAALVVTAIGTLVDTAAVLTSIGVLAGAWLGIVAGRLVQRGRGSDPRSIATSRTSWALVIGLVVGAVVGEGLVRTSSAAFSWQGYLLRLAGVDGVHAELSAVAGIVGALVIAFVIVLLVDRPLKEAAASNPTA